MRGDFSIWRDERRQNFNGVLHQQGRVLLDADWNAQTVITNDWEDTAARDIIGSGVAAVSADVPDSFKIRAAAVTAGGLDLTVAPGRVWADGLLAYLDENADVHRLATYLQPPIGTPPPPASPAGTAGTRDAVVLEVWREEINGFQLPNLLIEPALGGPDTTERVHTEMAFRLLRLNPADTCDSIIEGLKDNFAAKGRLTVELDAPPPPTGDCPVLEGSGYTGFEHNLYRIEIAKVATGTPPMFKWSQFGGGLVGRGKLTNATRTITITGNQQAIINSGLSQFYMEVVSFDSARGQWTVAYGANVTLGSNGTLNLPNPATAGSPGVFSGSPPADGNIFFRLWNGIVLISDFDGVAPLPLQDGILLQFDAAAGSNYVAGDYWTFPVRAGEITNVTPLINHKPPEGIHYHRVPLGIIDWIPATGTTPAHTEIEDCRRIFQPLTRLATCCTFRVGDGISSHGDFTSIHAAVDALPAEGGEVCVLPGEYHESVLINHRRNITIKGCGPRTRVISSAPLGLGAPPVFHVFESQNIQILSLAAEAHDTGVGILLEGHAKETIPRSGPDAPLLNITLENLLIRAATRSAIEAKIGYNVTVRRCHVEMKDVATGWPAVFFIGEDSLIEENVIVVANAEDRVRGIEWTNPLDPNSTARAHFAPGGLQLGGGCERIRVINNVIARGIETGIILGSLETITSSTGQPLPVPPPRPFDPCNPCRLADKSIPTRDPVTTTTRLSSEGDLYEILIERNRIFNMGLNGIGAVGFFELAQVHDFVSVHGLVIIGNVIRRCMIREVTIPPAMLTKIGYGGIAVSHVEYLVIRDNTIEDNGPNQLEPVCGIFILYGEGIEISRNWIRNNGAKPADLVHPNPAELAKLGARGGIYIVKCSTPVETIGLNPLFTGGLGLVAGTSGFVTMLVQNGMPAAKVQDNIVSVPLGQALFMVALGAVSVLGNQFTSRGMVLNLNSPSFWASTVMIMNLGTSRDLLMDLLTFKGVQNGQNSNATFNVAPPPVAVVPQFGYLKSGNVLFSNNQCSLDLLEAGLSFALSSILIFSLDDVAFNNNQCDCNLFDDFVVTDAFLFGITLRANDNRFREGLLNAVLSAITLGLINITTDNESTHCLLVAGWQKLRRHNLVLLSAISGKRDMCRLFQSEDDDDDC